MQNNQQYYNNQQAYGQQQYGYGQQQQYGHGYGQAYDNQPAPAYDTEKLIAREENRDQMQFVRKVYSILAC